MTIIARFHAREGSEAGVEHTLREVVGPTRQEVGCRGIQALKSIRDPRLFFIHSEWVDEAAFNLHAELPHSVRFISKVEPLIDLRWK